MYHQPKANLGPKKVDEIIFVRKGLVLIHRHRCSMFVCGMDQFSDRC